MGLFKKSKPAYEQPLQETMSQLHQCGLVNAQHLGTTLIKTRPLESLDDLPVIRQDLKAGNVLITNVQAIMGGSQYSLAQLKQAFRTLRSYVQDLGGSMGRLGDNLLILTPNPRLRVQLSA